MIRFRPLLGPTLVTLAMLAVLIGLGVWQLQRLEWKLDLIARMESGIAAAPVPLDAALANQNLTELEWRPVTVRGRFLHDKENYLYATEFDLGLGVHVITPLAQDDGNAVLVDRGWVSSTDMDPSRREAGQIEGPVTLTGLVRLKAELNPYAPGADAAKRLWYTRDPEGMAGMAGVRLVAPLVVVANGESAVSGGPRFPGYRINLPNSHLQYALTWFGLALALVAVYLVYHHHQGRLSFGPKHGQT
jgi:surfeit locus 1 family protein